MSSMKVSLINYADSCEYNPPMPFDDRVS